MAEKLSRLIIVSGGKEYELDGGGGGGIEPGVPIPKDTVDSDSIVDDTVQMEDLNQSVKDAMVTDKDRVTQEELDNFNV